MNTQTTYAQSDVTQIFSKLSSLNQMREALAAGLNNTKSEITEDTFKSVCMPVGRELKFWSENNGYQARQISHKNRNPNNGLKEYDIKHYQKFQSDPKLSELKVSVNEGELQGSLYYYRITVTQACLHCHGEKNTRPMFIKSKYPDDKAFDFKPGDLRGLYSIYVPTKTK